MPHAPPRPALAPARGFWHQTRSRCANEVSTPVALARAAAWAAGPGQIKPQTPQTRKDSQRETLRTARSGSSLQFLNDRPLAKGWAISENGVSGT